MMAAAAFHKPTSVEEAVAWLAADEETLALAGGATLVAMMNARLVTCLLKEWERVLRSIGFA